MNVLHAVHDVGAGGLAAWAWLTALWLVMMVAMMAPAVWPWVVAFRRFGLHEAGPGGRTSSTALFTSGYVAVWLVYSAVAAALQMAMTRGGLLAPDGGATPMLSAGVLFGAGAFQFAALKRACLTHCRNPLTYFMARWRNGPANAFRMGFGHGLWCAGCCGALMTTMLVVGLAHVWWMAALAVAAFAEQATPAGDRVRQGLGVALVAAAVWTLAIP